MHTAKNNKTDPEMPGILLIDVKCQIKCLKDLIAVIIWSKKFQNLIAHSKSEDT